MGAGGRCHALGILETARDNAVGGPLPSRNHLVNDPLFGKSSDRHGLTDHHFPQPAHFLPERALWCIFPLAFLAEPEGVNTTIPRVQRVQLSLHRVTAIVMHEVSSVKISPGPLDGKGGGMGGAGE